jgi:hypothetical protein
VGDQAPIEPITAGPPHFPQTINGSACASEFIFWKTVSPSNSTLHVAPHSEHSNSTWVKPAFGKALNRVRRVSSKFLPTWPLGADLYVDAAVEALGLRLSFALKLEEVLEQLGRQIIEHVFDLNLSAHVPTGMCRYLMPKHLWRLPSVEELSAEFALLNVIGL